MYLLLSEVALVRDQRRYRRAGDSVVYARRLSGLPYETALTLDSGPSRYDTVPPVRYGTLYFDAREQACVVPDVWDEDDARQARDTREG